MGRRGRMGRLDTLLDMLEYKRPAGSETEKLFVARYIAPLPNAERDKFGNWHVTVKGDASKVLYSSHLDTVHREGGMQKIICNPKSGIITLSKLLAFDSNCLGADCTAGVFLMTQMIKAGVTGHYVFHYGEECGGIGSSALARNEPGFLAQFDMAIAFDRRGTTDVIDHQGMGRCCSDEFAWALAEALGPAYKPADGIYTDTAEYVDDIPECTNISVGYQNEHRSTEWLDSVYLLNLLDRLLTLDTTLLPIVRGTDDDGQGEDEYLYDNATDKALSDKPLWDSWGSQWTTKAERERSYRDEYLTSEMADVQSALRDLDRREQKAWGAMGNAKSSRSALTIVEEIRAARQQRILPGVIIKHSDNKKGTN